MGVTYRKLEIPRLEAFAGAGVFYGAALTEAQALAGQPIFVVGGGNSAGQAASHLSKYAAQVTLVVRGSSLAASMSDYLIRELRIRENIAIRLRTEVVDCWGSERLEGLVLQDAQKDTTERVAAAGLFILIGARPHTAWLPPAIRCDAQGYLLTGSDLLPPDGSPAPWPLARQPYSLETSLPGVFAAGDIRHRSMKRVAAAVGEGSMAIHYVHQVLGAQE
jgi:thioredoxin reductase (NADPH)